MPKVSVLIPSYNHARYLPFTLQSVFKQTYSDYEILVVDDCSTDETPQILSSFQDPRFRSFRNPVNLGWVANVNRSLEEAKGVYICSLNADDFWCETYLEKAVAVLDQHPAVGLVFTAYHQAKDEKKSEKRIQHYSSDRYLPKEEFFSLDIQQNIIGAPTVMARKACYEKVGPFDPTFRYVADWEMWLRILLHFDAYYLAKPLACWRIHGENLSQEIFAADHCFQEERALLNKIFGLLPQEKKSLLNLKPLAKLASARRLYAYAEQQLELNNAALFRRQAKLAISMHPKILLERSVLLKMGLSFLGLKPIRILSQMKRILSKGASARGIRKLKGLLKNGASESVEKSLSEPRRPLRGL